MQNTKRIGLIALAIAASAALASPTLAADATVGLDLNSAYVWRGLTFNDGAVAQPSASINHPAGWGFNVWGNFDLDDYDDTLESGEFSEVDLTLYYDIPVELMDLSIGHVSYLYPATSERTVRVPGTEDATENVVTGAAGSRELYFTVGQDIGDYTETLRGLSWGLFFAYDYDEVSDYYSNLSLAYGYDVNEDVRLELGGLVGYAGSDWSKLVSYGDTGPGTSGFNEWTISLGGTYMIADGLDLGAFIAYVDTLDEDVLPTQDVDVYGGVSVYYGF